MALKRIKTSYTFGPTIGDRIGRGLSAVGETLTDIDERRKKEEEASITKALTIAYFTNLYGDKATEMLERYGLIKAGTTTQTVERTSSEAPGNLLAGPRNLANPPAPQPGMMGQAPGLAGPMQGTQPGLLGPMPSGFNLLRPEDRMGGM